MKYVLIICAVLCVNIHCMTPRKDLYGFEELLTLKEQRPAYQWNDIDYVYLIWVNKYGVEIWQKCEVHEAEYYAVGMVRVNLTRY